ncbi:hypothetical protein GQ44DRAFT_696544 [Phaeosphaeriaceae sp. PMI808]|nr:hypothetical protein GQ44DRAFT_696544 [Phaeosphaeriaceae sp. PMI808]
MSQAAGHRLQFAVMSQSNRSYPPFNLTVQEPAQQQFAFASQDLQLNNHTSQQWPSPGSRSVQNNMPSPSTSVRSVVTAPTPRAYHRGNFHQATISPVSVDSRVDPSLLALDMLAPPGMSPRNNYNPIDPSYHNDSWNPYHLRNSNTNHDKTSLNHTNPNFKTFRTGPESVSSAAPISDSGFYSQSVMSHDAARPDQPGVPSSFSQRVVNLNIQSLPSEASGMIRVHSDQRSQISRASSRSGREDNQLKCQDCNEISKCNSDYRKHRLKHEKPFSCNVPGCKRNAGFTTINDLNRHKKSVHHIDLFKKSYQCRSKTCRNKAKIWPRLDNFKQHIERMHPDEDVIDLVKRSTLAPNQPPTILEDVSVAPIDTMIVGMEKSFCGQNDYESTVESDMRGCQEHTQWPINLSPTDLPLGYHQGSDPLSKSTFKMSNDHTRHHRMESRSPLQRHQVGGLMHQKLNKEPTRDDRNVAQVRQHTGEQQKRQHTQVSDAPLTKAQQQRQALKKFSQAVSDEMTESTSSITVDLEELVVRLLARTVDAEEGKSESSENPQASSSTHTRTNRTSKVSLTKGEAIKASQMISNLIKQSPGTAYSQSRKVGQPFTANDKICELCGYAVARVCDLTKHMKRHKKPYGCTYPKCNKRFGAKSDWKRHENSQHFQLEAFRCGQELTTGKICGEHFFREDHFEAHLKDTHAMSDKLGEEVKRRKIGKNCQHQFWCGFHEDIIELKEKRNAAWDERFDHIAHHFEKDKKNIEDWLCVEKNQTKRELSREMNRYVFEDEEEREREKEVAWQASYQTPARSPSAVPKQGNSRKRGACTDPISSGNGKKSRSGYTMATDGIFFCVSTSTPHG